MRKAITFVALACALAASPAAQKKEKPWTEWSKKDAEKILNDSPWGQTQTETDTSEMFFQPQPTPNPVTGQSGGGAARDARGSTNQATDVKYRIRFFSARPIRQAFARVALLDAPKPDPQMEERLRLFAEVASNEKIVVSVTFESKDGRFSGAAMQAFASAVTGTLKNNSYLEVKGRRLFVEEYVPPGKQGYGALYIFPRRVGEGPFITPESGDVRFVSEVSKNIRLDMKFKVSQMAYNGQLEY